MARARPLFPTTCQYCSATFLVPHYALTKAKYCSNKCHIQANFVGNKFRAGKIPVNSFHYGHQTWNKGLSVRLSPATEFKPGPRPEDRDPIGCVKVRKDKHGGQRAFVKVEHPNIWMLRAVVNWQEANGPLPKGMLIHHEDRDKLNDSVGNLKAMTRSEHLIEHQDELFAARGAKRRT